MPVLTLGFFQLTLIMRLVRAEMLEALRTDYVKFARARGIPERSISFRHALRNTMIPVDHHRGPAARLGDRLRDRHRDRVPVARPRRAVRPGGAVRRHPGDGRLPDVRRAGVRGGQPRPSISSISRSIRACAARPRAGEHAMRAPTATSRERFRRALWRAWDSDVAWSFRHSPVAIVASAAWRSILLLGAVLAPLDRAAESVRRRHRST